MIACSQLGFRENLDCGLCALHMSGKHQSPCKDQVNNVMVCITAYSWWDYIITVKNLHRHLGGCPFLRG